MALGATYAAQGNQTKAQSEFARALELSPDNPSTLDKLAVTFALQGKHREAKELRRRAQLARGA